MNTFPLLDYARSQEEKDKGITKASLNNIEWMDVAVDSFIDYLRRNGPSTLEEWKVWFINSGGTDPKSVNAFGAVAASASRRKMIKPVGTRNAKSILAHARLIRIWAIK